MRGGGNAHHLPQAGKAAGQKKGYTMTNEEIITKACQAAGITETVHTFAAWKSLGFSVKKGEHAMLKLPIWRYKTRKDADGEEKEVGDAFRVTAFFFGLHQVEQI